MDDKFDLEMYKEEIWQQYICGEIGPSDFSIAFDTIAIAQKELETDANT